MTAVYRIPPLPTSGGWRPGFFPRYPPSISPRPRVSDSPPRYYLGFGRRRIPGRVESGRSRLLLPGVAQGQERERGGQLRGALEELPVRVRPAAVWLLLPFQRVEQLLPPVVLRPLRVRERLLAQRVHRLGERHVVVEQPGLPLPRVLGQG